MSRTGKSMEGKLIRGCQGLGDEDRQLLGTELINLTFGPSDFFKFLCRRKEYNIIFSLKDYQSVCHLLWPIPSLHPPPVLMSLPSEGQNPPCESPGAAVTKYCELCGLKQQGISPSWFRAPGTWNHSVGRPFPASSAPGGRQPLPKVTPG